MGNVHRMFITHLYDNIERRNPETRKTVTTSLFRYETFYYLWVKRLFDIRRDIPSFYTDFSICPKPRATPATRPPAWLRWASECHPSSSEQGTQLIQLFKSTPTLPVRDVTHVPGLSSIWDSYWYISEWHVRFGRAREHLRSCLPPN